MKTILESSINFFFVIFVIRLSNSSAEQKKIFSQPENHTKPMVHAQWIQVTLGQRILR